jgi:putative Mn2+ efflux pump MntP
MMNVCVPNKIKGQSGIFLGLPSVFLFFISFGFGFRQKTKITTSLLIAGGTLLAVTKIIEPTLGLNLYLAIAVTPVYISLIITGFILIGLGLWRLKMK